MDIKDKSSLAKDLRRVSRELELERKQQFGDTIPKPKSWDSKKSRRQERQEFKRNANRLLEEEE